MKHCFLLFGDEFQPMELENFQTLSELLLTTEETGHGKYYYGLGKKGEDSNKYFLSFHYQTEDKNDRYFRALLIKRKNDNVYTVVQHMTSENPKHTIKLLRKLYGKSGKPKPCEEPNNDEDKGINFGKSIFQNQNKDVLFHF